MADLSRRAREADRLLVAAEREYTPAAFARAFAVIEELDPQDPLNQFRRAGVAHALAEMRGDLELLRGAIRDYERVLASGGLPHAIASMMPALIEDARDQLREAERAR